MHLGTKRFSTKRPLKYVFICFARRYVKLVIPALIVLLTTLFYPLVSRRDFSIGVNKRNILRSRFAVSESVSLPQMSQTASPREGFYFNNIGSCAREWWLLPCLQNNYIDLFREQCLTHLWYISTDLKIYPLVVALSVFYRRWVSIFLDLVLDILFPH